MSTIVITGANRGIALSLAKIYLARDNNTVIATARNPSKATELRGAPKGANTKLIIPQYEAGAPNAAKDLIAQLSESGITKIDILVSSGGAGDHWGPVLTTPADKMEEFFRVNTLGNLLLFQAAYPLLETSEKPIFLFVSSSVGSTGSVHKVPFQGAAYGGSKAWVNHIVRRIHFENKNIISFAVHPG
jgi:norsolorinic acid ketoreductase